MVIPILLPNFFDNFFPFSFFLNDFIPFSRKLLCESCFYCIQMKLIILKYFFNKLDQIKLILIVTGYNNNQLLKSKFCNFYKNTDIKSLDPTFAKNMTKL